MSKIHFTLFLSSFISCNLLSQSIIKGKVLHGKTPIKNVSVYLNRTTIGTITNEYGEFIINVKKGSYKLIISHLGFKTIFYDLNTSLNHESLSFSLEEQKVVLDEVVLSNDKYDLDWQLNLLSFELNFIGRTQFSKNCKIQNPKDLFFEFDAKNDILVAHAKAPLLITNNKLGYKIYYNLESFILNNKQTSYLGYSKYEQLKGGKSKQKKWEKNRLIAYNGSIVNFYRSVIKNTTREDGFIINQFKRQKNKERLSEEEYELLSNKLAKERPSEEEYELLLIRFAKDVDYLYKSDIPPSDIITIKQDSIYLHFEDNLSIVYLKEKEERGYSYIYNKIKEPLSQRSNIVSLTKPALLDEKGVLVNPLNVIYEGYWAFEKFANSLPLDYDPSNKTLTNNGYK